LSHGHLTHILSFFLREQNFPKKGNKQNKPQEIVTRPSHAGQAKQ
jgi:hypothetical protein